MEPQRQLDLTYLFITHDLTLVHYVSDAIAVLYLGKIVEKASTVEIFENPLHPYTEVLLSSTPALDPGQRRQRIVLQGSVPDPARVPSGCASRPRCPKAMEICRQAMPQLVDAGGGHLVSCHLVTGLNSASGAGPRPR
jgi:oligopeptide/dipeptide ABC transporter ATP-binding protein